MLRVHLVFQNPGILVEELVEVIEVIEEVRQEGLANNLNLCIQYHTILLVAFFPPHPGLAHAFQVVYTNLYFLSI